MRQPFDSSAAGHVPENATHVVTGFNRQGQLLVQTWHIGHSSAQMEWDVWKTRINRPGDEAAEVHMIDREHLTMRKYP